MRVTNQQIASIFIEIAELLDIEGANPFRIRAYRNAARTILSYPRKMAELVDEGFDLTTLRGIGKDLAAKITEIVQTGQLAFLKNLEHEVSPGLEELIKIPGLGPKRVRYLHETLDINSLQQLKEALDNGRVAQLSGFGPKLLESIRQGLEKKLYEPKRYRLDEAEHIAASILRSLEQAKGVVAIQIAGSIRRRKETVKDIDIIAACETDNDIMREFVTLDETEQVVMHGNTRSSVVLRNGIHVDLRVVPPQAFGAALHHFTGSKLHNIALRTIASKQGVKLNEYGVFKDDKRTAGENESDIYTALGMGYIEPELRENRGEIEAATRHELPELVKASQIRGDLHIHTTYTDGANTLKEMALAAKERGYEYIGVTDHTKHLTIAHGLDEKRIRKQLDEIDRLNEELDGITLLKSAEVDILSDGGLDLPDSVLKELDLTVCAVHYQMNLSTEKQTSRILKAMENPYFTILAHPTGRLLGLREAYAINMEHIIEACSQRGAILELNAQPDRLDINDLHCRIAKEAGVAVAISTDAHSISDLELMRYGIGQARRGWLEQRDVLNTKSLEELRKALGNARL